MHLTTTLKSFKVKEAVGVERKDQLNKTELHHFTYCQLTRNRVERVEAIIIFEHGV